MSHFWSEFLPTLEIYLLITIIFSFAVGWHQRSDSLTALIANTQMTDKFLIVEVDFDTRDGETRNNVVNLANIYSQTWLDQVRFPLTATDHLWPHRCYGIGIGNILSNVLMSENSFWSKAWSPDWLYTFVLTLYETCSCLTGTTRLQTARTDWLTT